MQRSQFLPLCKAAMAAISPLMLNPPSRSIKYAFSLAKRSIASRDYCNYNIGLTVTSRRHLAHRFVQNRNSIYFHETDAKANCTTKTPGWQDVKSSAQGCHSLF